MKSALTGRGIPDSPLPRVRAWAVRWPTARDPGAGQGSNNVQLNPTTGVNLSRRPVPTNETLALSESSAVLPMFHLTPGIAATVCRLSGPDARS